MNFNEVLEAMKKGKKIRRKSFNEGEYLIGCHVGVNPQITGEDITRKKENMSVARMRGEYLHPTHNSIMSASFWIDIMADDWEIVE